MTDRPDDSTANVWSAPGGPPPGPYPPADDSPPPGTPSGPPSGYGAQPPGPPAGYGGLPPGTPSGPPPGYGGPQGYGAQPPPGYGAQPPGYPSAHQPYPPQPGQVLTRPAPAVPPRPAARQPVRVEPMPGTPFAVAYLDVPPTVSGAAIGSLIAGIASLLAVTVTGCIGLLAGQSELTNVFVVVGAFAVPTTVLGAGAVGLGLAALRQIRRTNRVLSGSFLTGGDPAAPESGPVRIGGRGMAIAGIICGGTGLAGIVSVLGLALVGG